MTKADLVAKVARETGLSKTETTFVVDKVIEVIKRSVVSGESIEIRRFGVFQLKRRKKRIARNPRTGEPVPIPERFVPFFKPSVEFKKLVKIKP